jgi:hypothetical protein
MEVETEGPLYCVPCSPIKNLIILQEIYLVIFANARQHLQKIQNNPV